MSGLSVKRRTLEKKGKFMEDGIVMASKFLNKTLRLDVSMVDVEIVSESSQITSTDGCSSIFIDGSYLCCWKKI